MQLAAETPAADDKSTVIVGLLTLAGTVVTAGVALWAAISAKGAATSAAESSASAARFVAQSDRYAEWQNTKRAAYELLLEAIGPGTGVSTDVATRTKRFATAFMHAYPLLWVHLADIQTRLSRGGELSSDEYQVTARLMRDDVNQSPAQATKDPAQQEAKGRMPASAKTG